MWVEKENAPILLVNKSNLKEEKMHKQAMP